MNKFDEISFKSEYYFLAEFCYDLEKTGRLDRKKEHIKTSKTDVYDTASELYNEQLEIYFDEYYSSIFLGVSKHFGLGKLNHFILKNFTKKSIKCICFIAWQQ